ncbi:MAG: hypothetical protein HRU11_01430 [Parvularculaceae bacterium]|nr:hypothetical protein [Parvularculaceae bacterium]
MDEQAPRRGPSWYRSMAEVAFDFLPGSGLARAAFEQIRGRIRADLEDEIEALKKERDRDQETISRLSDVVERQTAVIEQNLIEKR